jgi:hypothetical protein
MAMANMGCQVRTFDLYFNTIDEDFRNHPNISFDMVSTSLNPLLRR